MARPVPSGTRKYVMGMSVGYRTNVLSFKN
jgi:hypothetical protein